MHEAICLVAAISHHAAQSDGSPQLELWQAINLAGSIALAIMFLPPVIDDLKSWRKELADRT